MRVLEIPEDEQLLKCNWCATQFFVKEDEGRCTGDCITFNDKERILGYAYSCPTCYNRVDTRWKHKIKESNK